MGVFLEIGAVTGGFPVMIDDAHEARIAECLQAVVDGCQRNGGYAAFYPHKDLNGAWMICFCHQGFKNRLALFGLTQPFSWEGSFRGWVFKGGDHDFGTILGSWTLSRIILIKLTQTKLLRGSLGSSPPSLSLRWEAVLP